MAGEGDALLAAVRADPLFAPFADALDGYARPSIRLRPDRHAERYPSESRVGGPPAVSADFVWPKRHIEMPTPSPAWIASSYFEPRLLPLDGISAFQFVAQIDLAAVAPYDVEGLLPIDGTLLFFYDDAYQSDIDPDSGLKPQSWSTTPDGVPEFYMRHFGTDQVDQVRVIHLPVGTKPYLSDHGPHATNALPLVASQDRTLPNVDVAVIAKSDEPVEKIAGQIVLPPDVWSRFADLEYQHRMNADIDQMLGWADCGSHGPSLAPDFAEPWTPHPIADVIRETLDSRLLLQLSPATYEPTGLRFGRTLYFYVRDSDLRRADFSRAWYDFD